MMSDNELARLLVERDALQAKHDRLQSEQDRMLREAEARFEREAGEVIRETVAELWARGLTCDEIIRRMEPIRLLVSESRARLRASVERYDAVIQ